MQDVVQFDSDYSGEDDAHPYFLRYGVDFSPFTFCMLLDIHVRTCCHHFPGMKPTSVLQGHPKLDVSHIKVWDFRIIQSKIAPQKEIQGLEEARATRLSCNMLATISQDTTNF